MTSLSCVYYVRGRQVLLELDELVEREVELEELRAHHLIGERVALVVRLRLRQHEGHVLKVTTNVLAQLFRESKIYVSLQLTV